MSDKSRDAEPEREDLVAGEPDAAEPTEAELVEDDSLSIDDIEDPEALAAAEEAVIEDDEDASSRHRRGLADATDADAASDDEAIAELEENFTPEELAAAAAAPIVRKTAKAPVRKKDTPRASAARRPPSTRIRTRPRTPLSSSSSPLAS